eukprot:s1330_g22.t1
MTHAQKDADLWPWVCPCGRINKKQATACALCQTHWSKGRRHDTTPRMYQWQQNEDWDWNSGWNQGDASHAAQSPRGRSKGKPGKSPRKRSAGRKGQGKGMPPEQTGKGKFGEASTDLAQPSPFNVSAKGGQPALAQQPWPAFETMSFGPFPVSNPGIAASNVSPFPVAASAAPVTPSLGSTTPASSNNIEMAAALRNAYKDKPVPPEVQEILDRADQELGRNNIKALHSATAALGRAQKKLREVVTMRNSQRLMWTKHVTEAVAIWENQLESYRIGQAQLTEQAVFARMEVGNARKQIAELSARVDGSKAPEPPPAIVEETATEETDVEEQQLRAKLQEALKACASALGIEMPNAPHQTIHVIPDDDDQDRTSKRPRSLEPGHGSS